MYYNHLEEHGSRKKILIFGGLDQNPKGFKNPSGLKGKKVKFDRKKCSQL